MYRNHRTDLRKKFNVGDILVSKSILYGIAGGMYKTTHEGTKCKIVTVRRNTIRVKALNEASGLYEGRYCTFKDFEVFGSWELCMNGIQRARSVLKRHKSKNPV
jgi:hypothetical protein